MEGAVAKTEDLKTYVELIGNTVSNATYEVMAFMPAQVVEIKAEVGDYVEEGQVLFTLDGSDVQTSVTQAELGVEQAGAAVGQASLGVTTAQKGVESAQLAYNMAKSSYDMNLANYEFAVENLEKYEKLYKEGIVSEMEYEQMKLQAAPETMDLLEQQLKQAEQALTQAKLGVEQAGSGYNQANVGLKQAEEGLKNANDVIGDLEVTAPATGYVTAQNLIEKAYASSMVPAIVIDELQVIKVTADVTANLVNALSAGDQVEVEISANDKTYEGTIETVGLTSDSRTLLYPLTVVVDNNDLEIKPGMFATVKVVSGEALGAVCVPTEAVVVRDGKDVVFVQTSGDTAMPVEVVKGLDTGYSIEILEGINPGDVVITNGVGLIDESTVIRVVRGDE